MKVQPHDAVQKCNLAWVLEVRFYIVCRAMPQTPAQHACLSCATSLIAILPHLWPEAVVMRDTCFLHLGVMACRVQPMDDLQVCLTSH